jgi:hypothetical protein
LKASTSLRCGFLQVAQAAQVGHFIYLSVAHPAPVMQAYVAARVEPNA